MKKVQYHSNQSGFSSMEVLLSATVFTLLVSALIGVYLYGEESTSLAGSRARATMLAKEGVEAVRNIRDAGFINIPDGTYGLSTAGNQWNLNGSSDVSDIFTRSITIKTDAANKKSITSSVAWQQNAQRAGSVEIVTRLNNWIRAGIGDWSIPIQQASINIPGNNDGIKIQVENNFIYMIRNGGVPNFIIIDVSNPGAPFITGFLALAGIPTNIIVSGNHAYVSNINNTEEMQIIDITNKAAPVVVGVFNAVGNADGRGVYILGNNAYLTRLSSVDNEFIIIDVSVPNLPVLTGSVNLNANGNEVVISGNYAYVATSDNIQEMKVVDIANPGAPFVAAGLNLPGNNDALTVTLANTKVYLGQGNNLYVGDVANPLLPNVNGVVGVGGLLNDIAISLGNSDTYAYVATSENAREFKVIDVSIPAAPAILGFVNMVGNNILSGIAYDTVLDRAFGASNSNTEEFVIFAPQ
ncbi:MAG: hypothetical protein AAB438_00750 [Patescibacteria group bacterium]